MDSTNRSSSRSKHCYHAAARRCSSQATHERMLDQDRTESMPELDGMIDSATGDGQRPRNLKPGFSISQDLDPTPAGVDSQLYSRSNTRMLLGLL